MTAADGIRSRVVGRLAPSPTGLLHLGHARSFLLAWWHARSRAGRVLLRMEDLDQERCKDGLADQILLDLEWLGLDWDGPVVRQSERGELYRSALATLDARGLLYPCVCSRREIAEAQQAPQAVDGEQRYPGTCRGLYRDLAHAEAESGRPAALRFTPSSGLLEFEDGLLGAFQEDVAQLVGDFPLTRRDGAAAYQLAVVVDDAEQGVNEVLRGEDLLASTARQADLQSALGLPSPSWYHVPLVTDESGRRLAKRTDDLSLADLRATGVHPGQIVAWAAHSAGLPLPGRPSAAEVLSEFRLDRLPPHEVAVKPGAFSSTPIRD